MDYQSNDKLFIKKLSENIMNEQLNMIHKNTKKVMKKFNMKKNHFNNSLRNWTRSFKKVI